MNEHELLKEIQGAFSLDDEAAGTALVLLKARAKTLDYTLGEYMERYHPAGIAARDETLDAYFTGYVDFLGNDAQAIMRTGKGADFSTFVHECAHVFRRQLTGDLREKTEETFGIQGGKWTREQEEDFAHGLERWVEKRRHKNEAKREIYRKGGEFVDTVYRGIEHVIDIDPRMEAVYEKLFEDNPYKFNRQQFEDILQKTAEGKLPENSHVFLGMTPRVYEELGFERLPMAVTSKHLYTTLHENGEFDNVNYHGLGADILRQIPEQLKKPLCIVQSPNDETDIISIVKLKDKDGNPIVVPIAQRQSGHINNAEIDINLVKSVFGKDGFEQWLKTAIDDGRLLYINKKETEPALNENLITLSNANSIRASNHSDYHHPDISGFYTDNIARYRESVKAKFGERPPGLTRLYRRAAKVDSGQLTFDFGGQEQEAVKVNSSQIEFDFGKESAVKNLFSSKPARTAAVPAAIPAAIPAAAQPLSKDGFKNLLHSGLSLPNTHENFETNFVTMSERFQNDRIEAARYLLRVMPAEERGSVIQSFRDNGLTTPESIRSHLREILDSTPKMEAVEAAIKQETGESAAQEAAVFSGYKPFGAWTDFNRRLSVKEREAANRESLQILETAKGRELNDIEKGILRRYSGFGGLAAGNERGVLYDYYTSPPVADLTWKLLEKAGEGIRRRSSVLEPSCGTGVFFEAAPQGRSLQFTGVELDERTAGIAKLLHEENGAEILNQSFEAFNLSKHGSFDYIIGNAPFGERSPDTAALDMPSEKSLDNYFVSRSIDNLKTNGVMALIAAPGVLENKSNEAFRLELNKKAQFVGAVKLPNKSFNHANTKVEPDILLFRKYPADIINRLSLVGDETFKKTPLYNADFVTGAYFQKHPEHIMGEVSAGTGQWGSDEVLGEASPEALQKVLHDFIPADRDAAENSFAFVRGIFPVVSQNDDGKTLALTEDELANVQLKRISAGELKTYEKGIYVLTDKNDWKLLSENETLVNKINDIKLISNSVKEIQNSMREGMPQGNTQALQSICAESIEKYKTTHGDFPKDDADIKRLTREHPAVKGIYESFLAPDDPLLKNENIYRKDIEKTDGHNRAVSALLSLRKEMKSGTEDTIRAAFPADADSLIEDMRTNPDIFVTPAGEYMLREDFIQGDAWQQIDALREAAGFESTWKKEKLLYGAAEFEKAVGWTPIEDAAFSPRSSWIPQEVVRDWAASEDGLDIPYFNEFNSKLAKNDRDKWGVLKNGIWHEENAPLVYYLNGQKQRSSRIDTNAFNADHDDLFRSYISNHETYRDKLENEYNRKFKTHIVSPTKTYPVHIDGWQNFIGGNSGGKTLKPHQWQSIHHLYRQGCGISALGTGFGKTATSIGLMSLLRQEDKAHRIFLQVPNNKVKDWIAEIHDVMPSLKIAACDPEAPGYSNRDKRYAWYQKMAQSNADIILMPESAASEIQLAPKNDAHVSDKIASQYKLEKKDNSARSQELAEIKGKRKAVSGKTNRTINFEDFGCDCLIVDEAHNYKNLFSSSLSRETGLNDGRQSAKAMSLYKKSEYIRQQNNGKNVFLLTATPLTNSPLEYYNMLQYIAPEELQRMGVNTIDGFIREFAKIENGWLYDWTRSQAKEGRILTGFKNLPTLQNLFFAYTDLQNNPDAIGLEKPTAQNIPNIIPQDKLQVEAIKSISEELDRYKKLKPEERDAEFPDENFLTFYSKMRTASLDLSLYDPETYKNWKNPKLDKLSSNAFDSYKNTKGGQVIFCDRVFSADGSFNIHEKIKQSLVEKGFKEKDIVIVNGFTKSGGLKSNSAIEKDVSKAIADYNSGKYKVIIGSTACVGEGVNLQKNSAALHHFDIPFRPSDFIQRNGRIDRQGNSQEKVTLHSYLAQGTIDNYSVSLVQRKANWIDQLLRTKSDVFTNPNDENNIDTDELLLALTEEWGDKEAAQKQRAEMNKLKEEKIKEAQTTQMKGYMKNLSLARGSLASTKENSKNYKKRAAQIDNIESALSHNPAFTRKDLLQNREPFLYNAETNSVFRKGDLINVNGSSYFIESLNYKKQELSCSDQISDAERKIEYTNYKQYTTFKISELKQPEKDTYHNRTLLFHFEKADAQTRDITRSLGNPSFHLLPDDAKALHYDTHLKICRENYNRDTVMYIADSGKLALTYTPIYKTPLNPFSPEGKMSITETLKKGLDTSTYNFENALETLHENIPEIGNLIQNTLQKQQDAAREKEQLAAKTKQSHEYKKLQNTHKLPIPIKHIPAIPPVVSSGRRR